MKKKIALALALALTAANIACSNAAEKGASNATNGAANNASPPAATANTGGGSSGNSGGSTSDASHATAKADDEVPAIVRAALSDAQSITKQHKDISASQIAEIEKDSGTKIKDADHHSYLGFSTTGGTRKQTGAATVVEADGKEMVIVYESRKGLPYITEVRAEGVPQAFLAQFKGKGHDDKLQIGQDLKAHGLNEATARAAAGAIRQDTRIMQALYGGAHTH